MNVKFLLSEIFSKNILAKKSQKLTNYEVIA
jgi:hypothetical protein